MTDRNLSKAGRLTFTFLGAMAGGLVSMFLLAIWTPWALLNPPAFAGITGSVAAMLILLPPSCALIGFAIDTVSDLLTLIEMRTNGN